METYYICVIGMPMGIPVPDEITGYEQCYEIYKSGTDIKHIKLVRIGDNYEDQTYLDVESYITKKETMDNRLKDIDKDFTEYELVE